ncbi:MAG: Gfo/Idh/MocA family oxidoreductase [Cyclobacteriaceae bacterium]
MLRVLVVGCGNMGKSHALAYHNLDGFEICGLVSRGNSNAALNNGLGGEYPLFSSYESALEESKPDAVCISTYPDTHEQYAVMAFEKGCHVFLEKPIALDNAGASRVVEAAIAANKKLVVGYILRHHPSWIKFIELSQSLGKPLVMRMNLNQQSSGDMWDTHKSLMKSMSPIVDCGVHYVDVMCQMTGSQPVQVSAIGAKLSEEIDKEMYNYGQLQVRFKDGSVGWYEAGWGPMMSETAFFVKDVVGPKGSVSIVAENSEGLSSDDIDMHTQTQKLKVHKSDIGQSNEFLHQDELINLSDEPDHNELCEREQRYFLQAIVEDLDLSSHMADASNSLKVVLAADQSIREERTIKLD